MIEDFTCPADGAGEGGAARLPSSRRSEGGTADELLVERLKDMPPTRLSPESVASLFPAPDLYPRLGPFRLSSLA